MHIFDLGFAPWAHYRLSSGTELEYRGRAAAAVLRCVKEEMPPGLLDEPKRVVVVWVGLSRSPTQEVLERALQPVVNALRKHASAPMMVSFAWRAGEARTTEIVLNPKER